MKVLGLVPVRNEAWVLRHTLSCLSEFCDVVLVQDQDSEDESRGICRDFPKVQLIASTKAVICEQARFGLLDAAREFDGNNFLWFNDADELVSPSSVKQCLAASPWEPGMVMECRFYNLWKTPRRYRDDLSLYRPHFKAMGFVDDRTANYDRSLDFPLHTPRVCRIQDPTKTLTAPEVRVLHLQWIVWERNQMKQAWYRCREWLNRTKTAAEINALYSVTFDAMGIKTTPVPPAWVEALTFPDASVDREPSWHEREILSWFDRDGVERFEPLEIWHLRVLRDEFKRRLRRRPRPDRSYKPRWTVRVRQTARAAARALKMNFEL